MRDDVQKNGLCHAALGRLAAASTEKVLAEALRRPYLA